ncbi:MAG: hypothetical protein KY475_18570 [Planctomycetes bacterium]|nr:hypothetical protein [Planctomycetota bacterium]
MARKKRRKRQPGVNKTQLVADALSADPDASPKALSERFAAEGIEISPTHVSNIKSSLKRGDAPRTRRKRSGGVTKTQAIKEYFSANPKAMPKQAAEDLTRQHGMEFSSNSVSTIKHQMKKKGELRRRRGRPAAAANAASGAGFSEMMAAKDLVQRLGGVEQAKQALDAYSKLVK